MSTQNQLRWSGMVSIVAGFLMLVAAALRGFDLMPLLGQWAVFAYVVLLFFTFTAVYAVQAERMGAIGFTGFVMSIVGLGFTEVIAFLILAGFAGLPAAHDVQMFAWSEIPILHLAVLFNTLGAILLGAGTIRARVLPRWTGVFLIVAAVTNVLHEYLMPLPALMIVPALFFAGAFIGLGWALWSRDRARALRPHLAS